MITRRRIRKTVDLGILDERCIDFEVLYSPGFSEAGRFGQPQNYDPGRASEIDILKATIDGVNITPLIESHSAIYDEIISELDAEEIEERAERRKFNFCGREAAR